MAKNELIDWRCGQVEGVSAGGGGGVGLRVRRGVRKRRQLEWSNSKDSELTVNWLVSVARKMIQLIFVLQYVWVKFVFVLWHAYMIVAYVL